MTSNVTEAYNNSISKDLNYSKVSLLHFIEILRKRQGFIELDIFNVLKTPVKKHIKLPSKTKK
jgi:hypothetical protein